MRNFIYIFAILLFTTNVKAQITPQYTATPPSLVCVKNETSNQISIQWNASVNPGPCFKEYGVYIAKNDKNGPYVKVASITNPAGGTQIIDPQTGGIAYVFLINEQSCPNTNTQIVTSDTLDNSTPPPAPKVIKITVENEVPVIYWEPSTNVEVVDYAIFSLSNNYNTAIDTVYGRNSNLFSNLGHNPSDSAAVYRIRSIEFCEDPKGLYSNITGAYNTIHLTYGDEDLCRRSIPLSWNGYNNQGNPVLGYRVDFSMDNGNTFVTRETLPDSIRQYTFTDLTVQEVTVIRVVALLPGNEESLSNIVAIFSKGVAAIENHYIQNITVNTDHVAIEYMPDPSAELGEIGLERSTTGQQYTVLASGVSVTEGNPGEPYIIKDYSALTDRTALYYKVAVKNSCADKYTTLPAKTIFMEGENLGLNNQVNWDEIQIDEDVIAGYELYKIFEGDTVLIRSTTQPEEYTDAGVYANNFFAELCYVVKAQHYTTDATRPGTTYTSLSNVVCLKPTPQAFVPNAFAPAGHNKIFKPIIVFGTEINYSLQVFDRNGKKVFESTNPGLGWNGTLNGKKTALDSYVYHLQFTGLDGQSYKKTGFVVLVQ